MLSIKKEFSGSLSQSNIREISGAQRSHSAFTPPGKPPLLGSLHQSFGSIN